MDRRDNSPWLADRGLRQMGTQVRRAFVEFAAIPVWMIVGFLLLAAGVSLLDRGSVGWLGPLRQTMQQHVFTNARSTNDLLGTIATSLITITSITFSLLLLAVQQSAASLTSQVLDQYLRRRFNQIVFGFFVGLALYSLTILSTVDDPFNPVLGATLALILMAAALAVLPILLYSTIDQMRPSQIIDAIHDHTLLSRHQQLALLRKTRRRSTSSGAVQKRVRATEDGFVTSIDVDGIGAAIDRRQGNVEVLLRVAIGSYIAYQDVIAEIRPARPEDVEEIEPAVLAAVCLDRQRDLDADPAYGIHQLVTIAWTSISTSKQNLSAGILTVQRLRDLLTRWCGPESQAAMRPDARALPIVYNDDVLARLMDAFEALAIVSTESMQHQVFAEVVRSLAMVFERLPPDLQDRAADIALRTLSGLGDHVPAADLDAALSALGQALTLAGKRDTAAAVAVAQLELNDAVGKLNSRSTRVHKR
jgi:uncharacterized membrane protein